MKAKRIVIADRDPKFCEALSEQLGLQADYVCQCFGDAGSVLASAEEDAPDILLIDIALPEMPVRDLHEALRAKGVDAAIIFMLRAGDEEAEESLADLEGVHDFIMRPFRLAELLSQVKANLRATEAEGEDDIPIGPYRFRPAAKILLEEQAEGEARKIRLTEKEADILKFLSDEEGRVVPRDVLLAEVWGYNSGVTTHTLETHIYRLRQKIEENSSDARILVTEAGGYRLVR